ncbi:MAG: hypothetical protein AAF528_00815 [Cyanobacteria bacterium P01_C01_bin.121]
MNTAALSTAHQRRLRAIVKRLVIELGYLEHCLATGLQDANVETAAAGIDTAIDCLNEHLAS